MLDNESLPSSHPRSHRVQRLFERQAALTPEAVAVVFEERSLSYRELNRRSDALAQYLAAHGVGKDIPVGVHMERSLDLFVAILGVLKAGGAYVPVDPAYPEERVRLILRDCGARLVLTQERLIEMAPEGAARRIPIESLATSCAADGPPAVQISGEDLAYLIYTSGSTGQPNGVAMGHAALSNLIGWHATELPLRGSGRVLQFSALSFDVSFQEMFSTWCAGGTLISIPERTRRDADALIHLIDEQRIERVFLPFVALQMLAAASCRRSLYPSTLRDVVTAGEQLRITPEIRQLFHRIDGSRLLNHYGPTETHVVTSYTMEGPPAEWPLLPSIGRELPGVTIHILDANQEQVPIGVEGELHVGGIALARGYWNQPEFTRKKFVDDPFSAEPGARLYKTGDVARRLANGTLEFLGRSDDQVKIRGFRVELGEIEAALGQHPAVRECAVVAREDDDGARRLIAYVTAHGQTETLSNELRQLLKNQLPEHMQPAAFLVLGAMPLTPSGKIDRKALPEPEFAGAKESRLAPRSQAEALIASIWADVLRMDHLGVNDNFFDLGGHSLLATQIVSRIRDAFHIELPLQVLFEAPTVAALAERVEALERERRGLVAAPLTRMSPESRAPLSLAQRRLWFLDQLHPLNPRYNVLCVARLRGELQAPLLERSLNAIVQRHESLRTRFDQSDGVPVQVVDLAGNLPVRVVDLTSLPEQDQEDQARRFVREEAALPFDLKAGPLLRAYLIKRGESDHLLVLNIHHIVTDGWSLRLLVQEMAANYNAFLAGDPSPLPELPVQYKDFAVWHRDYLAGEVLEKQLSYWTRQLEGAPTSLKLPTDRPRPAVRSYRGALEEMVLPNPLLEELKSLSRREGATLFMTLFAAFHTVLSGYSGQQDFTVGMPIAGRHHRETEGLIGFFVNLLVLRCDSSGDLTFRELLRRVRPVVLEAYTHQDLPFETLVEKLRPERSMNIGSLCQVAFGMQISPEPAKLGDVDLNLEWLPSGESEFDLSVHLIEEGPGLRIVAEYSTDLFDGETIVRLLASFQRVLEGVAFNPEEAIRELPLLPPAESQRVLADWNATETSYPRDQCIHQLFEQQVDRTPEAVAVVFGSQQISYRELNRRSNRVANYLRTLGVKPGDLVGICVNRSLEMAVGLLGILKSGGAYVPLDPAAPIERLEFVLKDTHAAIVLTQENLRQRLPRTSGVVCVNDAWSNAAFEDGNPNHDLRAEDLAYVMYTSGSTGTPKGVEIPHRGVVRLVRGIRYVRLTPEDVLLQLAPLAFDASTFEIWGALLNGARLVMMPPHDATLEEIGDAIRDHKITTLWLTAGLFHLMVEARAADLIPVRQLLTGGDVVSSTRMHQAFQRLPHCRLINGYGPTESTTFVSCYTVDSNTDWERPLPIGRPISNTQVYILNASLQPVPIGVTGELCVGGDGLARGYLNRPELTANQFVAHPFSREPGARIYRTGDLARYRPDGNIEFLGRIDHQVKVRGFRIELGEIEAVVKQHPDVAECVVIVQEHGEGDKRLVAYVVPKRESLSPANSWLPDFLKQKLPEYMVPAAFMMLPNLPVTPNGKIDRKALPAPDGLQTGRVSLQRMVAPRTLLELQLEQIWSRILNLPNVGMLDNFFDIGGHSLLAVQLISEIHRSLGRSLPLALLFQNPTIEAIAKVIGTDNGANRRPQRITLRPGNFTGALFFLDAGIGLCRLAQLVEEGPASFGTIVPLTPAAFKAAVHGKKSGLPSLKELATAHAALIRSQHPSDPLILAGHSFGGILAFEVAHQLQREGRHVNTILLFDSWALTPRWWQKLKVLTLDRARSSMSFRARHLWSQVRARGAATQRRTDSTTVAERDGEDANMPFGEVPWSILEKVYLHAWKNYSYHPLDSRAVLFRARDSELAHLYEIDGNLGWEGLFTRGLEVIESPGDHYSVLTEPCVRTVAQRLQQCLEKIRRPSDGRRSRGATS